MGNSNASRSSGGTSSRNSNSNSVVVNHCVLSPATRVVGFGFRFSVFGHRGQALGEGWKGEQTLRSLCKCVNYIVRLNLLLLFVVSVKWN